MKKVNGLAWLSGVGLLALPLGSVLGQELPRPTIPDVGGSSSVVPINVVPPATNGDGEVTQVGDQKVYRPRDFLTMGIEAYRKADYEVANLWFTKANDLRDKLTDAEQKKLDEHMTVNATAIKMRKQAFDQMTKASQALQTGKFQEADQLLKSLNATPYLTPGDRQTVAKLSESLRTSTGGQFTSTSSAEDLMKQAGDALKRRDWDAAEALARQASQAGYNKSWYQVGKVSPDDVIKACQEGRKLSGNIASTVNSTVDKAAMARNYCKQAYQAASTGDVVTAKAYLKQAEDLKVALPLYEEFTTDKVKSFITQVESRRGGNVVTAAKQDTTMPTDPKAALSECRSAMAKGDFDRADALARHAKNMNVSWGLFGDNPDKAMKEIAKFRDESNTRRSVELMAQSRKAMTAGQFDDAERMAYEAKKLKSDFGWTHMGDTPDKLLSDIQTKKATAKKSTLPPLNEAKPDVAKTGLPAPNSTINNTTASNTVPPSMNVPAAADNRTVQANQMLAQARVELSKGNYPQAMALATQVKSMNVPTTDKADDIIASVNRVSAVSSAKNDSTANTVRLQALQKLAMARKLQKDKNICDANKLAMDAKSMGAVYQAGDETPEGVMADLKRDAQSQVETYSKAAEALTKKGHAGEAQNYRNYVAKVNSTFGLSSAPALNLPTVNAPVTGSGQGVAMLNDAEKCLKEGDLEGARKIANSLYTGPFDVKAQAGQLLAKIDAASEMKAKKDADSFFDLMKRAYSRKEFDVARSYANKIDPMMLEESKRKQLSELMSTSDMLPKPIIQMASAQDQTNQVKPADDKGTSLVQELKDRQKIESDRLRQLTSSTMTSASTLSSNGKLPEAIEKLKATLETVKKADPEVPNVTAMANQLEDRLRKLETLNEQQTLTNLQKNKLDDKNKAPARRVQKEIENRERLADLMKEYNTYFAERKYDLAEKAALKARELDQENPAVVAALNAARMNRSVMREDSLTAQVSASHSEAFQDIRNAERMNVGDNHSMDLDRNMISTMDKRRQKHRDSLNKRNSEFQGPSNSEMNKVVSIEFNNKPLQTAIKELSYASGVDIDFEMPAITNENIDLQAPISMAFNGRRFKDALERMLTAAQLTYFPAHGGIVVTTTAGKRSHVVTRQYPVHDLVIPRDDMGSISKKHHQNAMEQVSYGPTNSTSNLTVTKRDVGSTLESQLIGVIKNTISPDSWKDVGGEGRLEYYPLGMTLIVSQSPDIHEQIQDLLAKLREMQEVQITIEVRLLNVTDQFFERIGIDFNVLIPDKNTNFDRQVANNQFGAAGQLNSNDHLKNVIVGLTPLGNFTNNLDIPISNDSFRQARLPTGFAGIGGPGSAGGLDIGVAFLSSIEVFMVLEAVQGDVRRTNVNAPKITLFNGQTASIADLSFRLFATGVNVFSTGFNLAPAITPSLTPFPAGTSLTVQAVTTPDRRYVQLTLLPTISTVSDGGSVTAIAGISLQTPVTTSLTIATTVMVPDGGTILMGGFKRQQEQRREFGPPILSKIPYVQRLFRNNSYGREAETILFMVSPRIIILEEEEEKLGNTYAY